MSVLDNLISHLGNQFAKISDHRNQSNIQISLKNILLSSFAMFALKDSSLLHFIKQYKTRAANLKSVYGITQCASDTAIRQVLDKVPAGTLKNLSVEYIQILDQEGLLTPFELKGEGLASKLLIPIDGSQHFVSKTIHCEHCMTKKHKDGSITYHHNSLCGVIVHPAMSEVLVIATEEIEKQDGKRKNDHELQAAQRLLPTLRKAIGTRSAIIGGDALFANAPCIRLLRSYGFNYLLNVKEGSQGYIFIQFDQLKRVQKTTKVIFKTHKVEYTYEYANNLYLNGQNQDLKVNFIAFTQTNLTTGETTTMTWITDLTITQNNYKQIVEAGRTRWKIENETFNTLKNQGYNYEHNYGHGQQYLSQNFAHLMFLAFLFDQIQQLTDKLFRVALLKLKSKKALWERIRQIFDIIPVNDMETILNIIIGNIKLSVEFLI